MRGLTPILIEVLLWVKCCKTARPAPEKLFVEGRVNQWDKLHRCLFKKLSRPSSVTSLISQEPSTLRQDPPASKKIITCWRLRWWLPYFSNEVFLNYGTSIVFLRQWSCILKRLQHSVSIASICTGKPKNACLILWWCSLYFDGLEPKWRYLWGMPVFWSIPSKWLKPLHIQALRGLCNKY